MDGWMDGWIRSREEVSFIMIDFKWDLSVVAISIITNSLTQVTLVVLYVLSCRIRVNYNKRIILLLFSSW